jgi:hypothetical protein
MIGLMPDNLGLAGGLGTAGPTIGPVFWSNIAVILLNPTNIKPNIVVQEGAGKINYFGPEVALNTPRLFWVTSILIFASAICLPIFLKNPEGMKSTWFLYLSTLFCDKLGLKKAKLGERLDDNRSVIETGRKSIRTSFIEKSVRIEESTKRSVMWLGGHGMTDDKSVSDMSGFHNDPRQKLRLRQVQQLDSSAVSDPNYENNSPIALQQRRPTQSVNLAMLNKIPELKSMLDDKTRKSVN